MRIDYMLCIINIKILFYVNFNLHNSPYAK